MKKLDDAGAAIDTTFAYATVNVSENNSYELITMTNAKNAVQRAKSWKN